VCLLLFFDPTHDIIFSIRPFFRGLQFTNTFVQTINMVQFNNNNKEKRVHIIV
jgi:hypothetical protein